MSRILIVDDDPGARRYLRAVLRRDGYRVRDVATVAEAISAQTVDPADLVVTDIVMPDREGLELVRAFRQAHPIVPILAISGGGLACVLEAFRWPGEVGALHTLRSPVMPSELRSAVLSLLREANA